MRMTSAKPAIGAAVFAFVAALILPALLVAQEARTAPPARPERPGRMLVREALDLTPEQEKALAEFRKAREEGSRIFRDEMTKLRSEMRELARDPGANQAKLDGIIDKTARLRAEREKSAFRARIERDKIFTPEQREKMKAFRESFANRQGSAGRGLMGPGRMGLRGPGRWGRPLAPRYRPHFHRRRIW